MSIYGPIHKRWSKEQIVVPLFVTDQELSSTSGLFPLEFLEIQEHHRMLGGRDPFVGFHVDTSRLKIEVLRELDGNVVRLRQRFVEGGGSNDAVTILLPLAVTSTIPLLRGVQRVMGWPVLSQSDAVIKDVADRLNLDLQGLHDACIEAGDDNTYRNRCSFRLTVFAHGICRFFLQYNALSRKGPLGHFPFSLKGNELLRA